MAVGFSNTNKPLNPRGNDASPKGYNRAELYSGKALDFDGVNDYVDLDGFTLSGTTATISFYYKSDSVAKTYAYVIDNTQRWIIGQSDVANKFGFYDGITWRYSTQTLTNNKWYHITAVIDGGDVQFLWNGQSVGDTFTGVNSISWASLIAFKLGWSHTASGGGGQVDGQIAGFKIFNTALTAAQVADLYNNPEKIVPTGVADSALKLYLPMQEGAGTTAFNGAPDAVGSELITNGTFDTDSDWSKTGDWEISGGSANSDGTTSISNLSQNITFEVGKTYRYSFTISNRTQGGVRAYIGAATGVLNESNGIVTGSIVYSSGTSFVLQSRNNFIGSIDNVSIKEENNFGTISGATWTHGVGAPVSQTAVIDWNKVIDPTYEYLIPQGLTAGRDLLGNLFENVRKQGALNLDGNSWAEVHDNASIDLSDANASFEAWIYYDGTADQYVFNKFTGSGAGFRIRIEASDNFGFYTSDGTNAQSDSGTEALTANAWNHIVLTTDGTNFKRYIDGVLADTDVAGTALTTFANAGELFIGCDQSNGNNLNNQIAQPRIYDRALTAAEVLQNYNSGKSIYTNS